MKNVNSNINIVRVNDKLTEKNASAIIEGAGIIIDCLDNFQTRHIINEISVKMRIPMIHAGVSEFFGQITFLHPPETPCLACFIPGKQKKGRGVAAYYWSYSRCHWFSAGYRGYKIHHWNRG